MSGAQAPAVRRTDRVIYRARPRRTRQVTRSRSLLWRFVGATLISVVLSTGLFLVFVAARHLEESNYFVMTQVTVIGNHVIDRDALAASIGIPVGTNIFDINLEGVRQSVLDNPYVQDVFIRRELPATLVIEIVERKPIALLSYGHAMFLLSEDGVLLEEIQDNDIVNYPVISEASLDPVSLGDRMERQRYRDALTILMTIRDRFPEFYTRLQTVEIQGSNKAILKIRNLDGLIILSTEALEDNLLQVNALLPRLSETSFKTIDFRFSKKAVITFQPGVGR